MTDEETTGMPSRRGRRTESVAQRDESVYDIVAASGSAGVPTAEIAIKLNVKNGIAYLSLYRLRHAGRVQKVGPGTRATKWMVTPATA